MGKTVQKPEGVKPSGFYTLDFVGLLPNQMTQIAAKIEYKNSFMENDLKVWKYNKSWFIMIRRSIWIY